jgi:DNA-binding CsgD family transcriptional regulator
MNTVVATLVPVLTAEGEFDRAAAMLGTVARPGTTPRSISQRQCRFAEAELTLARGEPARALAMVDDLAATRPSPSPDDILPQIMKLRGDALARLRRSAEAEAAYETARSGAVLLGFRPLLWRIEQARGELLLAKGQKAEAEETFQHARDIIAELAETIDDPAVRAAFRERALGRLPQISLVKRPPRAAAPLSPRELDVLRHLVEGKSDREIAAALSISPRTVMRHVTSILDKLGVSSRTAAATLAVRNKLV